MTMKHASDVAERLSTLFLTKGYYEDASPQTAVAPAAADGAIPQIDDAPFAGLAVRAVGYGNLELDEKPGCYVYVTRSSRALEKRMQEVILDGIQVCVRKVGRVQVKPEAAAASTNRGRTYRHRNNKITCGSSIGVAGENTAGTLGAFLESKAGVYCLSNNHVLGGCNHTPKGHPILSPSTIDARAGGPQVLQFAQFESLNELRSGDMSFVPTQRIDAAIAAVMERGKISTMQGSYFDTPPKHRQPMFGEAVKKVGRTTGLTSGIVESKIPTLLPLPYKAKKFAATVNYSDIWTVRSATDAPFALPGDSGSLVVADDEEFAIGLLFACSSDGAIAWIASLPAVMEEFKGYHLATGIGV